MFKKNRKKYYIVAFTLIFLIIFFYWQNHTLQITRYELTYENLPESFDGYRIVQISDMHGKKFGMENIGLAKKIKSLNPDILLITGDMMSSTINDEGAFFDFLDHFNRACPIYMCLEIMNKSQVNLHILLITTGTPIFWHVSGRKV